MVYKIENMTNKACNNRAHNQQEEKREESWRTPNIMGNDNISKVVGL